MKHGTFMERTLKHCSLHPSLLDSFSSHTPLDARPGGGGLDSVVICVGEGGGGTSACTYCKIAINVG